MLVFPGSGLLRSCRAVRTSPWWAPSRSPEPTWFSGSLPSAGWRKGGGLGILGEGTGLSDSTGPYTRVRGAGQGSPQVGVQRADLKVQLLGSEVFTERPAPGGGGTQRLRFLATPKYVGGGRMGRGRSAKLGKVLPLYWCATSCRSRLLRLSLFFLVSYSRTPLTY